MPIDVIAGQRQVNSWGSRIYEFHRSRVAKRTLACCFLLAIYIVLGEALEHLSGYNFFIPISDGMILGLVLSVLLVLRTNSAYDRWWEARKSWGVLVNDSRNLTLKLRYFSTASGEEKKRAVAFLRAFPFLLRDSLRENIDPYSLSLLPEPVPSVIKHPPSWVAGKLFEILKSWRSKEYIGEFEFLAIEKHVSTLMDVCGVCERIKKSPLPLAHRALTPFLLVLYLFSIPVALDLNVSNMVLIFIVSYFMIALELIAEDIEEPFGTEPNDIPLDDLCLTIDRSLADIFAA